MSWSHEENIQIQSRKMEFELASKTLKAEKNRILRDFQNIQDTKANIAKESLLSKLQSILLQQLSFKLNAPKHEIGVEMNPENGWNLQILDGESNILAGLHSFCNAATLFKNNVPVLSIAHLPMYDEIIICEERLQIASPITSGVRQVSTRDDLKKIICVSEYKFSEFPTMPLNANMFTIIFTGLGRLDAFILKLPAWQVSIAKFYIEQAGGKISNIGPFTIGSNALIHTKLRETVLSKVGTF